MLTIFATVALLSPTQPPTITVQTYNVTCTHRALHCFVILFNLYDSKYKYPDDFMLNVGWVSAFGFFLKAQTRIRKNPKAETQPTLSKSIIFYTINQ
jgi:hypothetical protein